MSKLLALKERGYYRVSIYQATFETRSQQIQAPNAKPTRTQQWNFVNQFSTPDSADVADVRRYLGEFLMDPFVLSAPTIIGALIVYGFILCHSARTRVPRLTPLFGQTRGSPLLTGSQELADELASELQAPVVLSMRYGNPSIQSGINELAAQGVEHVIVVPLYAQHADSTVTTSLRAVEAALPDTMQHSVLPPFYGADEHSQAWAN